MGWDEFMKAERDRLWQRRRGKLRRALGVALPGEDVAQLDSLGEQDHLRAEEGLLAIRGREGKIVYKHIDDMRPQDMDFMLAAERVETSA